MPKETRCNDVIRVYETSLGDWINSDSLITSTSYDEDNRNIINKVLDIANNRMSMTAVNYLGTKMKTRNKPNSYSY